MSGYRPDVFGTTPPRHLWSVFNGVALRWQLDPAEQRALLGGRSPQPPGSPPPDEATATRIDLLKDCCLHAELMFSSSLNDPQLATDWVRGKTHSFALCPRPRVAFKAVLDSRLAQKQPLARQLRNWFIRHACHQLSPLEIMASDRTTLLRIPIPLDFPHINQYWRQPDTAPDTLGLDAMRGLIGRVSGAEGFAEPADALRRTIRLIRLGEQGANPL